MALIREEPVTVGVAARFEFGVGVSVTVAVAVREGVRNGLGEGDEVVVPVEIAVGAMKAATLGASHVRIMPSPRQIPRTIPRTTAAAMLNQNRVDDDVNSIRLPNPQANTNPSCTPPPKGWFSTAPNGLYGPIMKDPAPRCSREAGSAAFESTWLL